MKKSFRSDRNKKVAILSLLGFLLLALTGFYMYNAYTQELSSSAATCNSGTYSCNCTGGPAKELKYNYCDARYSKYQKCTTASADKGALETEIKKTEIKRRLYRATHKAVVTLYEKAAGEDHVLSNNECRIAKYCTDSANDDNPVNTAYAKGVVKGGISQYAQYAILVKKVADAKAALALVETEEANCKNDSTIYESNKQTYLQNQCARLCNSKTAK